MKRLCIFLILISRFAFGQEEVPDLQQPADLKSLEAKVENIESDDPTSLLNFPALNSQYARISLRQSEFVSNIYNTGSVRSKSYSYKNRVSSTEFSYYRSVESKTVVFFNLTYVNLNSRSYSYASGSPYDGDVDKFNNFGFADPGIGAVWHLSDYKTSEFDSKLSAFVSPKFGEAKSSTYADDGNAFKGGHSLSVSATLGGKVKKFDYEFFYSYAHIGSISSEAGNTKVESRSIFIHNVGAQLQFSILPKMLLNLGIGEGLESPSETKRIAANGTQTTASSGEFTNISFFISANYKFDTNSYITGTIKQAETGQVDLFSGSGKFLVETGFLQEFAISILNKF